MIKSLRVSGFNQLCVYVFLTELSSGWEANTLCLNGTTAGRRQTKRCVYNMCQNVARQNVALPITSRDKTSRFKTSRNENVAF
jgi:hypothetical protein